MSHSPRQLKKTLRIMGVLNSMRPTEPHKACHVVMIQGIVHEQSLNYSSFSCSPLPCIIIHVHIPFVLTVILPHLTLLRTLNFPILHFLLG